MQSDQHARGFAGCSEVGAAAVRKARIEAFPVNLLCKNTQRMVEIQKLLQLSLKQIQLAGLGADRGFMPVSNCKVLVQEDTFPCNFNDTNLPAQVNCEWSCQFFRDDSIDVAGVVVRFKQDHAAKRCRVE